MTEYLIKYDRSVDEIMRREREFQQDQSMIVKEKKKCESWYSFFSLSNQLTPFVFIFQNDNAEILARRISDLRLADRFYHHINSTKENQFLILSQ